MTALVLAAVLLVGPESPAAAPLPEWHLPTLQISPAPAPAPLPSVTPETQAFSGMGAGCEAGPVHDLIVEAFGPIGEVDTALAIASRESGCNPNAYNGVYGASGVFQIVPSTWSYWSAKCGYAGADVFDAGANVPVAACMVEAEGWGPWAL